MKLKDTIEVANLDDGDIIAVNEEHDVGEVAIAGSTEDFEGDYAKGRAYSNKIVDSFLKNQKKGTYILLKAVGTLEVK
tara:strand:+ start:245 stop:478 length:234 start_codon:yes stop_codon:yes gene_type:complete